ncbi:hypothetical protein A9299_03975 [Moraxella osloensis]|uniref:2-amino-4-hydroxy-6-hydroxymethyldihydropteridine pyrophosphokinase n=1 Tax=Faucicola osloensis TaxID=34062 RepID=A0AA91FN81_FAUOS|nr:2-amino-4-hydroxy-6-hydroxymethyldihydropteridine diphosphokinase [Moraxella osloensis]OBX62365.1 hypothetical protein A9299_03975 [Moraxella osloensis]
MSVPPRDVIVIEACVLSLASNVKQPYYLQKAKDWLQNFGTLTLSAIHPSEDIRIDNNLHDDLNKQTSNTPVYFNQVAYLDFEQPIDYWQWLQLTKKFEQQQERLLYQKPAVTLDIDIIAVKCLHQIDNIDQSLDEKGNRFVLFAKSANQWLGIRRRFPLACYDQVGIVDLSKNIDLSFIRSF